MAPPTSFRALTVKAHAGILNRILTDVVISVAFDPLNPPTPPPPVHTAKALWDTGATHSCISPDLATTMGLVSVGKSEVSHGGGKTTSPRYAVNLLLPHGVGFRGVLVTEFTPPEDKSFNAIIGMDLICCGDFAITNLGGSTWMSFRTPSCEHIDYVVEANKLTYAGVKPNDPCPCGSGKKFKRCHRP